MWVASADLPRGGGHPFYERLNGVLDEAGFDTFVERECATFYANRRRIRGARGRRLLRQRGERLERPHAHLYETGRLRRVHLRGHANVLKRVLVQVCGGNLGLLMRTLTGVGTPRSLQGRATALFDALIRALRRRWGLVAPSGTDRPVEPPDSSWITPATRRTRLIRSRYKVAVLPRPARPRRRYGGGAGRVESHPEPPPNSTSGRDISVYGKV